MKTQNFYAHFDAKTARKELLFTGDQSHLKLTSDFAAGFAGEMIPAIHPELIVFAQESARLL